MSTRCKWCDRTILPPAPGYTAWVTAYGIPTTYCLRNEIDTRHEPFITAPEREQE